MNGKGIDIEVFLSVIYRVLQAVFYITKIELKIKDYDIFGTIQ